jgi:hypothetical protein
MDRGLKCCEMQGNCEQDGRECAGCVKPTAAAV